MKSLYMGIDVSKGYADFTVINESKEVVERNYQLDDTKSGQEQLKTRIKKYFSNESDLVVYAAVESTGGYENHWYDYLKSLRTEYKIEVSRINPLIVSHSSKADMKRNGTDKISALNIAECLISHKEKIKYDQTDSFRVLKRSWTHITLLTKQKVQLENQLDSFMYESNPELLAYCKYGKPLWQLRLLEKYPTAKDLSKADIKEIAKLPYITENMAYNMVEAAKKTVSNDDNPFSGIMIKSLATQILSLRKAIALLKKEVSKQCDFEEIKIMQSFTGMGTDSATGLFVIIEDINRFASSKKLASFFGIHPVFKQSGDKTSKYCMSKRGSKLARKILFMVAFSAIRCNPHIKKIYERHLSKGMTGKAALGAIMHKITRIIYGMLKNKKAYDPQVDIKNSFSSVSQSVFVVKVDSLSRRYQEYDSVAPVSRRQSKTRKEQAKLQKV
jgi:transposase